MGGQGSGGHNSKGTRRDVQCARLDVHELSREGKLRLGTRGILFGSIWFEITGGPDAQHLVLEFPCRSASGEQLNPITQDILCYWRKAHYGGRYLMFSCSECHRSARVLYAWYFSDRIWFFRCRKCAGITYQSTMGHRWDRSARRVEKLRARLDWVHTAPSRSNREVCMSGHTSVFWGCLPIRGRAKAGGELCSKARTTRA